MGVVAPPEPPLDELELLFKEARARQRRRRFLGTAAVAVVAATGLAISAVTLGGRTPSGIGSGSAPGAVHLCRSSQLSVAAIWDGASGNLFNFFTIANRGASACWLPLGRPTVLLIRAGSQLKVEERAALGDSYPGEPVRSLRPGRRAVVHLDWFNWCGPPRTFAQTGTTVAVRFAGGLQVTAPNLLGQPRCIDPTQPSVLTVSPPLTPN